MVTKLLETNKDVVVFDLRKNNVVDIMAIPSIMNQLNDNKKLNDGAEVSGRFILHSARVGVNMYDSLNWCPLDTSYTNLKL